MSEEKKEMSKEELIEMFDEMIKKMEDLPPLAMHTSVTLYDLYSFMLVITGIFKAK